MMQKIFSAKRESVVTVDFTKFESHTAHHGYIFSGSDIMDEVVVVVFKSPNSYTGEDVAEISSHGGRIIYSKLNSLLIKNGGVHAEPGEFSKRAFLNGKLDLLQAEAISDIISAKTELSYEAAKKQLTGFVSNKINKLRDSLINLCSLVELDLDFVEEGLEVIDNKELINRIAKIIQDIVYLANSYYSGRIIKDGISLTIIGKPNAGKSSLFNYLLKDSRAIVSDIPGTTRDYLEESLILGGFVFNLIDTAGIRKPSDHIEMKGIEFSVKKMDEADLILDIIDLTGDRVVTTKPIEGKTIMVYNKADIAKDLPEGNLCVSALTGFNMSKLEEAIVSKAKEMVKDDSLSEVIITNERHKDLLLKSCEYLVNAKKLAINNSGNELISIEIREAMNDLGEILGKITNVNILNNIFSKFCIGK